MTTQELYELSQRKCARLKLSGDAYHAWMNVRAILVRDTYHGIAKTREQVLPQLEALARNTGIRIARRRIYTRCIDYLL